MKDNLLKLSRNGKKIDIFNCCDGANGASDGWRGAET